MITYGDAISYCIRHNAVFRFCERRARSEFIATSESIPGNKSLELAITIDGKIYAVHCPLDSSKEPSSAVASALIAGVGFMMEKVRQPMVTGVAN